MTGSTVGHYEIQEKLGEGGMGVVYKARDVLLNRSAALKFLPTDNAGHTEPDEKRRRFVQEAQSASALNHPNIITIYEVAKAGDRDFIAMELVQGQPLDKMIGRKPLPLNTAIACGIQIADALAAAHAAGIVHRDLKPGNVMVGDSGRVKVLDFGLAKLMAGAASAPDVSQTVLAESPKTVQGTIMGTVAYMSPEQAEGKPVDHRSDIFSFGALLYEMLTARRAFQGESTVSTLAAILTTEPAPLSADASGLPRELVRIVSRCMRKQPEKRWQSIADVRIALEELKQDLDAGRLDAPPASVPATASSVDSSRRCGAGRGGVDRPARVARPAGRAGCGSLAGPSPDCGCGRDPLSGDLAGRQARDVRFRSRRLQSRWICGCSRSTPAIPCSSRAVSAPAAIRRSRPMAARSCSIAARSLAPSMSSRRSAGCRSGWPRASGRSSRRTDRRFRYRAPASAGGNATPSIWTVAANGGTAKEIKIGKSLGGIPVWSPDGKGLLFIGFGDVADGKDDRDWYYVAADTGVVTPSGARQRLDAGGLELGRNLGVTSGGMLFADGNIESTNIYRLPLDAAFQKATGPPVPLIVGAGFSFSPTASQDGRRIAFAVGNNMTSNIWRAPLDPKTGQVAGSAVRITSGLDPSLTPSPSRDGKRLAYLGGSRRSPEIRIRELETGYGPTPGRSEGLELRLVVAGWFDGGVQLRRAHRERGLLGAGRRRHPEKDLRGMRQASRMVGRSNEDSPRQRRSRPSGDSGSRCRQRSDQAALEALGVCLEHAAAVA